MALYGWRKTARQSCDQTLESNIAVKVEVVTRVVASARLDSAPKTSTAERLPTCALRAVNVAERSRYDTIRDGSGRDETRRHETIRDRTRRHETERNGAWRGGTRRSEARPVERSRIESSRVELRNGVSGWRLFGASGSSCGVCCCFALPANHVRSFVTALLSNVESTRRNRTSSTFHSLRTFPLVMYPRQRDEL